MRAMEDLQLDPLQIIARSHDTKLRTRFERAYALTDLASLRAAAAARVCRLLTSQQCARGAGVIFRV